VRVLVTGGLGYVGRVVAARLAAAGHQVTALGRGGGDGPPGVAVARADLLDRAALGAVVGAGGFEAVCHLAALTRVRESFADPVATWAVNVGGTIALLEALEAPVRLVLASTGAVYGPTAPVPVAEDAPVRPSSPYAASKAAAEQLVGAAAAAGRVGAVTLRACNVAGAARGLGHGDPDGTRLLPAALAAAAGRREAFTMHGDGSVVREFVHVADLADAWLLALEAAAPGRHLVYNVGSGEGVSVGEVLAAVERVTGRRVPVQRRPSADEPAALVADSARIRAELGWAPARSGIDRIVADAWAVLAGAHESVRSRSGSRP
jgi:UDP-glucose 4-epimerase